MFKQFFDVFWPKAMEYVAEQGLSNSLNIKAFEHTLENLQENLKLLLSAKAIDVETEIKNAEDSGRKKRKREVEVWLEGVKSIEKEVDELGSEAESGGFVMRFLDGGRAAQLNADIHKLVQQRLNFGEPVLDSRVTREEILLTNGMVGDAFSENLETVLNLLESRQSFQDRCLWHGRGGKNDTDKAYLQPTSAAISRTCVLELPSLEYVHISSCREIEQIFEQDEDEDEGRGAAASTLTTILPRLKHLNLSDLPRLKRVSKARIISNSIQTISITKCPELLKKLPLHFGDPTPPASLRWIVVEREWWESLGWENTNIPLLLQDFLV